MEASATTRSEAASQSFTGAEFCTYRGGGPIDMAFQPGNNTEAIHVLRHAADKGQAVTVLGWGGNTIVASKGIRGITLITRRMTWINPTDNKGFEFAAGVHLAKVSAVCLEAGLSGAEFMIGIPGTVGGAIRMNAGALKQEMADVVSEALVYNFETHQPEIWDKHKLDFRYRKSAIHSEKHIVLAAKMQFLPGDPVEIKSKMDGSVNFRKTHHPTEPNGGSVFANPSPEQPVGMLLDKLGARTEGKLWSEGGVSISPKHCNFIINTGNGTSTDILKLMWRMKASIKQHYNLDVYPENKFVGDATDKEKALWKALREPIKP